MDRLLAPVLHEVMTRHTKNNFTIDWPQKTGTQQQRTSQFQRTKLIHLIPKLLSNFPLHELKTKFSKWLLYDFQ